MKMIISYLELGKMIISTLGISEVKMNSAVVGSACIMPACDWVREH